MNRRLSGVLIGLATLACAAGCGLRSCRAADMQAETAGQLFSRARAAYQAGEYDRAIESWERIVALGRESGNLYYNLGNSYFKKGEPGRAVLQYERAALFIPQDSDLRSNHEYVLSLLGLPRRQFGNRFERLADRLFETQTIDSLTALLSVIYVLALACLACSMFFPGYGRAARIALALLAVVCIPAAVALRGKIAWLNRGAVVIAREAKVSFEPLEGATTYFPLGQGAAVEILERTDRWYKVRRPDGKTGWIEQSAAAPVRDTGAWGGRRSGVPPVRDTGSESVCSKCDLRLTKRPAGYTIQVQSPASRPQKAPDQVACLFSLRGQA